MVLQVAKTTYETTPDAKVVAVDVYGDGHGKNIINNETRTIKPHSSGDYDFIIKAPSALHIKDYKIDVKSVNEAIDKITSVVKNPAVFKEAIKDNVLDYTLRSVGYTGGVKDLKQVINTKVTRKDILTAMGAESEYVKVLIGDIEKSIDGKDLGSVQGIMGLISGLTESDSLMQLVNFGAQTAVVKSYINLAMELRLPEAVDILIASCGGEKEQDMLYLHTTLDAVYHSDMTFLLNQINNPKIGAGAIAAFIPNVVSLILQNYRLHNAFPTTEDGALLLQILAALNPTWLTYDRSGEMITDLTAMVDASIDARRVLLKMDETALAATLIETIEAGDMVIATLNMRKYTPAKILSL